VSAPATFVPVGARAGVRGAGLAADKRVPWNQFLIEMVSSRLDTLAGAKVTSPISMS